MTVPNFNVEGRGEFFKNANDLRIGSTFKFVDTVYTVKRFTKEHIKCIDEKGEPRKFYDIDFENWITNGFMKIISL